jgi:hypothetical protein
MLDMKHHLPTNCSDDKQPEVLKPIIQDLIISELPEPDKENKQTVHTKWADDYNNCASSQYISFKAKNDKGINMIYTSAMFHFPFCCLTDSLKLEENISKTRLSPYKTLRSCTERRSCLVFVLCQDGED